MHHFFTPLGKSHTLYSIVPLSLNAAYKKEHLSFVASFPNCLLLDHEDFPHTSFQFFGKNIFLLSLFETRASEQLRTLPFTSLLVGPTYDCKTLLDTYFLWAHTCPKVFGSPSRKHGDRTSDPSSTPVPTTQQNFTQERHGNTTKSNWRTLPLARVWAKASASNIEVACMSPYALKKEISRLFHFSANITALPISSLEHHNEALAWAYAFYALYVSKMIRRHVVCHYHSVNNQYALYVRSEKASVPPQWTTLCTPTTKPPHVKTIVSPRVREPSVARLLRESNYIIRSRVYEYSKNTNRCVGFAHATDPILRETPSPENAKRYPLILKREKKMLVFTLPFLPSRNTLDALRIIASNGFSVEEDLISFELTKEIPLPPTNKEYSLLGNLMLQLIKRRTRRASETQKSIPKYIYKYNTHVSTVVEFTLSPYGKELCLDKLYISINAGYIAREHFLRGHVEKTAIEELRSLLGTSPVKFSRSFQCSIFFTKRYSPLSRKPSSSPSGSVPLILYTSTVEHLVRSSVWNAVYDAVSSHLSIARPSPPFSTHFPRDHLREISEHYPHHAP